MARDRGKSFYCLYATSILLFRGQTGDSGDGDYEYTGIFINASPLSGESLRQCFGTLLSSAT